MIVFIDCSYSTTRRYVLFKISDKNKKRFKRIKKVFKANKEKYAFLGILLLIPLVSLIVKTVLIPLFIRDYKKLKKEEEK
jgi:hypothetical protein